MYENYVIVDGKGCLYNLFYNGRLLISGDWDQCVAKIKENMEIEKYYPSIFYVNERGTLEELDYEGNYISS